MSQVLVTVQMVRTRLYRVILAAGAASATGLLLIDRFGPGIGLTPWDIGIIGSALTFLVTLARQIKDPATSTATALSDINVTTVAKSASAEGTISRAAP